MKDHLLERKFFSHDNHKKWKSINVIRELTKSRFNSEDTVLAYTLSIRDEDDKSETLAYFEFENNDTSQRKIPNDVIKVLHENKKHILSDYGLKLRKNHLRIISRQIKTDKSFKLDIDMETTDLLLSQLST